MDNQRVFKQIREKRKRWDIYRRSPSEENYTIYRAQNNKLKKLLHAARRAYEQSLLDSADKKFYSYIRHSLNSNIDNLQLRDGHTNEIVTDHGFMAELFATYFESVFTSEDLQNSPSLPVVTRCEEFLTTLSSRLMM